MFGIGMLFLPIPRTLIRVVPCHLLEQAPRAGGRDDLSSLAIGTHRRAQQRSYDTPFRLVASLQRLAARRGRGKSCARLRGATISARRRPDRVDRMSGTERRRLKFWVFPWLGAWFGIGGSLANWACPSHPIFAWIVGVAVGDLIATSIMFFLFERWGIHAFYDRTEGGGGEAMLTVRQHDLMRRFFIAVALLDDAGDRQKPNTAKFILSKCVLDDTIDATDRDASVEFDSDQLERQATVFAKLLWYYGRERLAKKLASVVLVCAIFIASYTFITSGWIWGVSASGVGLIVLLLSYPICLAVLAGGFSPLALGLTHTECRFACDEIVGHSRWRE
jgi:hypothetical protein